MVKFSIYLNRRVFGMIMNADIEFQTFSQFVSSLINFAFAFFFFFFFFFFFVGGGGGDISLIVKKYFNHEWHKRCTRLISLF